MQLSALAEKYVSDHGLRARAIVSNCLRFERISGLTSVEQISTEVLIGFRQACLAMAFSNVTTEKTITDVTTIVKHTLGKIPEVGKRLRQPRPEPKPAALDAIDAIWEAAESKRLQRWLAITYWTGLRISDSIEVYLLTQKPVEVLRHKASKTNLNHCWPVPDWLKHWLEPVEPPVFASVGWFGKVIRKELAQTAARAKVKHCTPKNIRQASITAWTNANATAGAIVHGSGLGVMTHYLDPLSVLQSAAPRVKLPSCFGAVQSETEEATLLSFYRRLDPAAQGLIAGTAQRLASG